MIRRYLPYFLMVVFVLVGCQDQSSPTDAPPISPPDSPEMAILDGSIEGGNPHFFWLPPVAPQPSFNGIAQLGLGAVTVVRVCLGEVLCESALGFDEDPTNPAVAEFTDTEGTGGAFLEVSDEHYQVDWKTSETELGAPPLAGETVRIWVLLGKAPVEEQIDVGFIDVTFKEDGSQARGRAGDALQEGRALPLRFRMENGVAFGGDCLDEDGLDCVEFVGTDAGFQECTEEDWACLDAASGWLPDGFDGPILIQVKQVKPETTGGPCFGDIPHTQKELCYQISTSPDLGSAEFNADVFFGMCQEPNMPGNFEIHQRASNGEIRRPVAGPGTLAGLDCQEFEVAMNPVTRLARSIHEFVFGGPLYAGDGLTARLSSFSQFWWGPAVKFADQDAIIGPTTAAPDDDPIQLTIQLELDHQATGDLSGIAIEIEVSAGSVINGVIPSPESDENGQAVVQWDLPEEPGTYTLTATIPILVEEFGVQYEETFQVVVEDEDELIVTLEPSEVSLLVGEVSEVAVSVEGGNPDLSTTWNCVSSETAIFTTLSTDAGCQVTGQSAGNGTLTVEGNRGDLSGAGTANVAVLARVADDPPGATAWNVPVPESQVSLCSNGITDCTRFEEEWITEVQAVLVGPSGTFSNPFSTVRFYWVNPETQAIHWFADGGAPTQTDDSVDRWFTWTVNFDATGVPETESLQIFAVGFTGSDAYQSEGNGNIEVVHLIIGD